MTTPQRRPARLRYAAVALLAVACFALPDPFPRGGASAQERPQAEARQAGVDKAALEREVAEVVGGHEGELQVSLWLGGVEGAAWFESGATRTRPTASSIKAFYLVELFDRYKGRLDEELTEAGPVLGDDGHPAVSHFTPEQREEIRRELKGASVRRVGEVMIGRAKVSNAVYNAAANVATAVLGGPEALTAAIRKRDAAFRGVTARRYMLRDRKTPGDNEATALALAALHQKLASASLAGIDGDTMKAIRDVLHWGDDPQPGSRFGKAGNLASDPLTAVRAGWWETANGTIVYVVMAVQPAVEAQTRQAAAGSLRQTAARLEAVLVSAGRRALEPERRADR